MTYGGSLANERIVCVTIPFVNIRLRYLVSYATKYGLRVLLLRVVSTGNLPNTPSLYSF